MNVEDNMTREVAWVAPETNLLLAYKLMKSLECRHLLVVRASRLVGLISDRDLLMAADFDGAGYTFPEIEVSQIMSPKVITCSADCSISVAVDKMLTHKIDALPIVNHDEQIVGIITSTDLLSLLKTVGEEILERPLPYQFILKNPYQELAG